MRSNVLAAEFGSILDATLGDATERVLVVNPDGESITQLVEFLADAADTPPVSLLAGRGRITDVMDDFLVASRAADLVANDRLELCVLAAPPNHSLLLAGDVATALVSLGDSVTALESNDESFVTAATDHYTDRRVEAEGFSLRTPPLARVRSTLETALGPDAVTDFDDILASMETARGDGTDIDEVTISLLVAARNGELLYDVSKWGEDVGLASKATFSRTKTTLEEAGLIETEKVPIEVGRPRLRLLLADDRLSTADAAALAAAATQRLGA